jgi:hypothetical protein
MNWYWAVELDATASSSSHPEGRLLYPGICSKFRNVEVGCKLLQCEL